MSDITLFDIIKKVLSFYKLLLAVFFISFISLYVYFSYKEPSFKAKVNVQENFITESETLASIVYVQNYFLKKGEQNMISWFDSNKIFNFSNYVEFMINENRKSEIILDFFKKYKIENINENLQIYRSNIEFNITGNLIDVSNLKLEFIINEPNLAKNFLEFFLLKSNRDYLEQNLDKTLYVLQNELNIQKKQKANLENIQLNKNQIIRNTTSELEKIIDINKYQLPTSNLENYFKNLAENLGIIEKDQSYSNMSITDEIFFINNLIKLNKYDLLNESYLYDKYYILSEKQNFLLSGYINSVLDVAQNQNQELETLINFLNSIKNNYKFHNYDKILNPIEVKLISFSGLVISIIISFAIILILGLVIIAITNYKNENN